MSVSRTLGDDIGKLILRLGLATAVLFHGYFKVMHGVEWVKAPLGNAGLPAFLAYGLYVSEIIAPLLLIFGILVRAAALAIALDMTLALVLVMRPLLLVVKPDGGGWGVEIEALTLAAALALLAMGGGQIAVQRQKSPAR